VTTLDEGKTNKTIYSKEGQADASLEQLQSLHTTESSSETLFMRKGKRKKKKTTNKIHSKQAW